MVTGGAGYVGSVCVERLLADGQEVTVVDNLSEGHRFAVMPGVDFYKGDIGNEAQLHEVMQNARPEAILHFAGSALVGESIKVFLQQYRQQHHSATCGGRGWRGIHIRVSTWHATCRGSAFPIRRQAEEY